MYDSWKSKKLWFAIGAIVTAFLFAVLAASVLPRLEPMYAAFLGFLELVTGAYLTGNVANKLVIAKANPGTVAKPKTSPGGPKVPDDAE